MTSTARNLDLPALNGSNPLGFLAALGTLVTLDALGERNARLAWRRESRWMPFICGLTDSDSGSVARKIAADLRGASVPHTAEHGREKAQKKVERARKQLKDKAAEIKKRKLRGAAREAAIAAEIAPLRAEVETARTEWLAALRKAIHSPELAIGKHLDCSGTEFREHGQSFLAESSTSDRRSIDLLAAFGCDCAPISDERIAATPFCFITGSGHQYFLDTARQLMKRANEEKVAEALFSPWTYRDEKLAMRWDPIEDRRYALMDRDPTASDNKSRTVWMANLLAYRALSLFSCAPTSRGLRTTGFGEMETANYFTWPLWSTPLSSDCIRSVLQWPGLQVKKPDANETFHRGIAAVFRCRRIQVGNPPLHKINFTPAQAV